MSINIHLSISKCICNSLNTYANNTLVYLLHIIVQQANEKIPFDSDSGISLRRGIFL